MNAKIFPPRAQGGMALIEALVSILILALGIFGLMGIQARSVVETRITNNRALAIREINDLNERIWLNREQALAGFGAAAHEQGAVGIGEPDAVGAEEAGGEEPFGVEDFGGGFAGGVFETA